MSKSTLAISFSGARAGLTEAQTWSLARLLGRLAPAEAHHGCATGADQTLAELLEPTGCRQVGHPSDLERWTSRLACRLCEELHPPMPPLARNHRIVDASELLVACPRSREEELRSGTWSAIRYARRRNKPVFLVYPDGEVVEEEKQEGRVSG